MNLLTILLLFLISFCESSLAQNSYELDKKKSTVKFEIKNLFWTVEGTFSKIKTNIFFDENNLSNSVLDAEIEVKSISTENSKRDEHLLSADFFDARKFPLITFTTKEIKKSNNGYLLVGYLKIKDISKKLSFQFEYKKLDEKRISLKSGFELNRLDYGVGEPTIMIGDNVSVSIQIFAVQN